MIKLWIHTGHYKTAHLVEPGPQEGYTLETGYFLTDSELKRVAQEAFQAARVQSKINILEPSVQDNLEDKYYEFVDYWAEQPARKSQ